MADDMDIGDVLQKIVIAITLGLLFWFARTASTNQEIANANKIELKRREAQINAVPNIQRDIAVIKTKQENMQTQMDKDSKKLDDILTELRRGRTN